MLLCYPRQQYIPILLFWDQVHNWRHVVIPWDHKSVHGMTRDDISVVMCLFDSFLATELLCHKIPLDCHFDGLSPNVLAMKISYTKQFYNAQ